ncbi:MAG: peptidylprolyl isomerase [Leptolyngbyaceae cyanobacterium CSU_1_3]|nr:peptidylprolyl isomerase [Leptolyngbyaceae cyanobacterium CSU_1_3]
MPVWNRLKLKALKLEILQLETWQRHGLKVLMLGLVCASVLGWSAPAQALPPGNAITDSQALLRYALPIDNPDVRRLQFSLEDITAQLRANRRWGAVVGDVKQAYRVLTDRQDKILASVSDDKKPQAEVLIEKLKSGVEALQVSAEAKDKEQTRSLRADLLSLVSDLEALMVQKFPYEVPEEYSNLPQLKGRATVAAKTSQGDLTIVLDGFSAPVTAGNFVDLVKRGFYDGLQFTRAEDSYVLQIGDPPGPEVGFIDPATQKYRAVPLEILVKGDNAPLYGITLEDAGRYLDQPVLPFSSFGALAMARPGDDPNGGSSQFFFFLFEPELTPAGLNLLDGRYAIFGFVTSGREVLEKLKAGDTIESMKVIDGLENLVEPKAA